MVKVTPEVVREVDRLLAEVYGDWKWRKRAEPIDELVATVLSQHTNDVNRDRAFERLKSRFPSWEKVLSAPTASIVTAIKPAGLSNQKAPRIKAMLKQIAKANNGKLSLDFLAKMPVAEAAAWLKRLPGVGPKTAACVLLFSFGKPIFPVDAHIFRISKRLGWLEGEVNEAKANELLDKVVPDEIKYRLHLNLIAHGRKICKPQKPLCHECAIRYLCRYYHQHQSQAISTARQEC
ncbi:MAG: endonuclease III domain-containing protein [Candidatus Fervidibacter sp.]|uniref:endonuclease III domain-containing protein n=2 Tax=Candidatus Fervidibacter sp. TaxID=3100871 RepID=UPI0040491CEC